MKIQELNIASTYKQKNEKTVTRRISLLTKQAELFEKNRFGLMALFLTLQSCVGSVAAMYLLQNNANDFYLMLCAGITMGANALLIAQAGGKTCVISVYANIIINLTLILTHL